MQLQGTYLKTLYADRNGIGMFLVRPQDQEAFYQIKGKDPVCYPGTPLIIEGEMKDGIFYAEDIKAAGAVSQMMIDYLCGGLFDGIGPVLAQRIVEALEGQDLFVYVKEHRRLPIVKGITQAHAESIAETILGSERMHDFITMCAGYGLDYAHSMEIYARYETEAEHVIKKQPYKLLRERLVDFTLADYIAKENGIEEFGNDRIEALIYQALYLSSSSGHTYTLLSEMCKSIDRICQVGSFSEHTPPLLVLTRLQTLRDEHKLVWEETAEGTRLYMKSLYEAEKHAAEEVVRLNDAEKKKDVPIDTVLIDKIEEEIGVTYEECQKQAFGILCSPGVKILTGGPGTGKTTTIKGLIRYIQMQGKSFVLCAPTGRAAQRMSEVCGHEASTIHKLLDIRPYGKNEYTCRGKENPIDADCVIVDEVSMVGVELFAQLLNAVRNGSIVILVGDDDQLSSVTPGNVLKDLIKTDMEVYRLEVVFRQKSLSIIAQNAEKIRKGDKNLLVGNSFKIATYREGENERMAEAASKLLEMNFVPEEMFRIQLLAPVKKGDAGVFKLNRLSQEKINPAENDGIHKGDRVIFLENNYEQSYFNGDLATVLDITNEEIVVEMLDGIKHIPRNCMKDLAPAYAVTIHKSQGSEYDSVVIVLPKCALLARNLLYTAVTRAKKQVIILTEEDALERCIWLDKSGYRHSALAEKITALEKKAS